MNEVLTELDNYDRVQTMPFRPLPDGPVQAIGEPIAYYGLRLLTFILETGVTATLTAEQLKLADHAANMAVQSREILPLAVDRISAIRHRIAIALRVCDVVAAIKVTEASPDDKPDLGPMAPLAPVPDLRPSPSQAVVIQF